MNITDIIDKHEPVAEIDVHVPLLGKTRGTLSEPMYTRATVEKMLGEVVPTGLVSDLLVAADLLRGRNNKVADRLIQYVDELTSAPSPAKDKS